MKKKKNTKTGYRKKSRKKKKKNVKIEYGIDIDRSMTENKKELFNNAASRLIKLDIKAFGYSVTWFDVWMDLQTFAKDCLSKQTLSHIFNKASVSSKPFLKKSLEKVSNVTVLCKHSFQWWVLVNKIFKTLSTYSLRKKCHKEEILFRT